MPAFFKKRFGPTVFWTGFVGFLLGILFSVTVWSTNRILQIRSSVPDENGEATGSSPLSMNVLTPSSGAVVNSESVTLSGTTSAPAVVVISGGTQDSVVDSGNKKFQTTYQLKEGENEIQVTAVDADGNETTSNLNLLFTTENLQ